MKELECHGRKSFYKKAMYEEKRGIVTLFSYGTKIISVKGDKVKKFWDGYSVTTQRHINEFLYQQLGETLSKNEYINLPCNKWVDLKTIS